MRRKDKEILDRHWMDTVLMNALVIRIAMCDSDMPYVVPMCFAYDGARIYLHSAQEGRKVEILRRNPGICFEATTDIAVRPHGNSCSWTMDYKSVIGTGTASFVEDDTERRYALGLLVERYTGEQRSVARHEGVLVIRIDIASLCAKHSKGTS